MYELAHIHKYDSNLFWDGRNTDLNYHWFVIYAFSYDEVRNPDDYYHQIGNYFRGTPLSNNIQIVDLYEKDEIICCVVKTLWLKIFQRKYKNYYNKKMNYYKNPINIRNRQITGKWV
tara:strand:- start:558 stop:908 length:351 start_codon:yes stop_codon:yes gene_type:complete